METSLPLNNSHVRKLELIINRVHMFIHGVALLALIYYRATSLFHIIKTRETPILPYSLVFLSELILSFIWLLERAFSWKPVTRAVFPSRLPEDDNLPPIDVFICTANPLKEPSVDVMNTVISAMALDYPPDKIHVYLSDDAGSSVTLQAVKEAWKFSKWWIPFCSKHGIKTRCPKAYFSSQHSDQSQVMSSEFLLEKKKIEEKYEQFKYCVEKIVANTSIFISKDHPPVVEVINDAQGQGDVDNQAMPLLVYVAREKRPSLPHHFKAGALNVLLRVSGVLSNSAYILVLDCDFYCNDPTSARQAMCFYLDPKISRDLAFVQFPQKFHNVSTTDIYDTQLRHVWTKWEGFDGLRGPILSGSCFYVRRETIYGIPRIQDEADISKLRKAFGSSSKFIKMLYNNYEPIGSNAKDFLDAHRKEMQFLACCTYDTDTKWGEEVGFNYSTVVEDYLTGFILHCNGWTSVYLDPDTPCFLGSGTTNLGDIFVQHTRWYVGLLEVALSRFSPLIYGPLRMSILESICYSALAYDFLNFIPLYCLAIVPQLCLLHDIPLYPQVSSPFFFAFLFIFLSSQLKNIQEVKISGHSIWAWVYEQRMWMLKSVTCYLYATLYAVLEKIGLKEASFLPTNKVVDDEQAKLYQNGIYDFQAPTSMLVPFCTLYFLNLTSFLIRVGQNFLRQSGNQMFIQASIPLFGMLMNYHVVEGILRKDKGRISPSIVLFSLVLSMVVLCFGSLIFIY